MGSPPPLVNRLTLQRVGMNPRFPSLRHAGVILLGVEQPFNRHTITARIVCNPVIPEVSNRPEANARMPAFPQLARRTHLGHPRQFRIRLLDSGAKSFRYVETGVFGEVHIVVGKVPPGGSSTQIAALNRAGLQRVRLFSAMAARPSRSISSKSTCVAST